MPWSYDPASWTTGTIPSVSDFQHIATDLHTLGGNLDAARHGLANSAFATLVPQELPGTAYTVTAGSWSAGTATLTIGAHNIQVGQLVVVASVTPSTYNNTETVVTGVTGTQISYAIASNPGAWTSGGTVTAWGTPANGMLATDANGNLQFRKGGSFAAITTISNPSFAAPTFASSWGNNVSSLPVAGYAKNAVNDLVLVGNIIAGTTSAGYISVFSALPAGFRPPSDKMAAIVSISSGVTLAASILKVDSAGIVYIYNTAAVSSGIWQIDCRIPLY